MSQATQMPPAPDMPDTSPAPFSGVAGITILFTPLTGGILAAINWNRFGKPNRTFQALLTGLVGFIIEYVTYVVLSVNFGGLVGVGGGAVVTFIFGGILAQMQRADYQQWVAAHGGKQPSLQRSGCLSALVVVVVSSFVTVGLSLALQPTAVRIAFQIQPASTYSDNSVTLTKPAGWIKVDVASISGTLCTQQGSTCLLAGNHGDDLQFIFNRFNGAGFTSASAQDIDSAVWPSIQQSTPSAKAVSDHALKVNGRDAYERVYTYTDVTGNHKRLLLFIKEDSGSALRLDVMGSPAAFDQTKSDIDALISGIQFAASKP